MTMLEKLMYADIERLNILIAKIDATYDNDINPQRSDDIHKLTKEAKSICQEWINQIPLTRSKP